MPKENIIGSLRIAAIFFEKLLEFLAASYLPCLILMNWTCSQFKQRTISQGFVCLFYEVYGRIFLKLWDRGGWGAPR